MRPHYSLAMEIRQTSRLTFSFESTIVVNVNIVSLPKSYTVTTSRSDRLTYVTGQFRRSLVMTIDESDEYILLKMDIPISPSYVTSDIKFSGTAVTYHNVLYIIVRRIQSCKKTSYRSSRYARRHFLHIPTSRPTVEGPRGKPSMDAAVKISIRTLPLHPPK